MNPIRAWHRYNTSFPKSQIGLLYVYRDQTEMETQKISKVLLSTYMQQLRNPLGIIHCSRMEGNIFMERPIKFSNRNNPDGLLVRSFGTIGEGKLAYLEMGSLKLRSGFASGDSDSSDGVYSTFTFDRDSNAGSLLFDVPMPVKSQSTIC